MTKEISKNNLSHFENIKKQDEKGNEYWNSKDLSKVLEYSEYRQIISVIERAKEACKNSKQSESNHYEDILVMIELGKNATTKHNNYVATSKNAGVQDGLDYAIFQNHRYSGLYDGLDAKGIHRKKNLKKS